jgi:hypothetical protein
MAGDPRYHENASDCPGTTWFSAGLVTIDTRFGDRRYLPETPVQISIIAYFVLMLVATSVRLLSHMLGSLPAPERRVRGCTL